MAFLLDNGANIDYLELVNPDSNPCRVTALHRAVEGGDAEHVWFLLERGARTDINRAFGFHASRSRTAFRSRRNGRNLGQSIREKDNKLSP